MENPIKPLGIHARILVAVFVLIGATTLTLGAVGVSISSRFMHERFNERMAFLARYVAMISEVGVLINDRQGLKQLADNLLNEKDVVRVLILDAKERPLVDSGGSAMAPNAMTSAAVTLKRSKEENIPFSESAGVDRRIGYDPAHHAVPLETIGRVDVYFSTQGIDSLVVLITKKFLWASLALGLVSVFLFYFLSRSIGAELKKLKITAQQIGRGDFTLRVTPGKMPETKALALSFNAMLDSLNDSQASLDKVHRKLARQKTLAEMGKFSLMIAHEVKNPLAIIKSSMDILKKDVDLSPAETMVEYIDDEVVRLNQLIEGFLQFSRPVEPVLREVDLNAMFSDVGRRFQMIFSEKNIDFELSIPETPVFAQADRDLLVRAFGNIIKNACEALESGGRIDLAVERDRQSEFWKASIGDKGPGIDPEDLKKIFDPFFTTRAKGTGLGLAFAAQVVKHHRGYVLAENRNGGGALFTITIPIDSVMPDAVMKAEEKLGRG